MFKIPKQAYTDEFKAQVVKRVTAVGSMSRVAEDLVLVEQTLRNWVKPAKAGKLNSVGLKAITPEQMELSRLRSEVSRLRMECEILKKRRRNSREMHSEVRLDRHATHTVPTACDELGALSQPERLPCLDAWGHAAPHTANRCPVALADSGHPRRTERGLRQSTDEERIARTSILCWQGVRGPVDARAPHLCTTQAPLQNDDGLTAHVACGKKPTGSPFHSGSTQSGVGGGHHLFYGRMKAGSIWQSCATCLPAKWWAGQSSRG